MTQAIITRMDARALALADASVDLIITSPPYWSLRSYTDGGEHFEGQIGSEPSPKLFIASLIDCTREWMRVLKPSGSIFVNLGDKYAGSGGHNNNNLGKRRSRLTGLTRNAPTRYLQETAGVRRKSLMGLPWRYAIACIDELQLILRAEIIWAKPNGLPESVKDRVARKHEQWFHFVKSEDYYANLDPIRQPHASKSLTHRGGGRSWGNERNPDNNWSDPATRRIDQRGVLPGSVWAITSEPFKAPVHIEVEHFAAFPSEWPKRLIQGWSPAGICTACGEGRRPRYHRQKGGDGNQPERAIQRVNGYDWQAWLNRPDPEYLGDVCACAEPTASTLPAVVLDPFGGTGTVALAAQELGRLGITNDMSADYCELARWRTTDLEQIARMRRRITGVKPRVPRHRPGPEHLRLPI